MSCVKQQFLSDISIVPAKQQLPSDVFHLCIFLVRCNVNERSGSVNECLHSLGVLIYNGLSVVSFDFILVLLRTSTTTAQNFAL